jgi:putative SOS response-associated peptidase YedK
MLAAMCYSAQIKQDYRKFIREVGARIDIDEFVRLYWERKEGSKAKIPRAMDALFAEPRNAAERKVAALVAEFDRAEAARLEQELFRQRRRLADAERSLAAKPTKAAAESRRIAGNKVQWALGKLAQLRRTALQSEDARIFPGWHAPLLVSEGGAPVIRPMRYQCRPEGKPAGYDRRFPGTYNARRDSLGKFWKPLFGYRHGILAVEAFFENVPLHRVQRRDLAPGEAEQNVVLEFRPRPACDMLVACLWSPWSGAGERDLLSFAAITDEPPPEVAAAGHDRCIVPIEPRNLEAWLNPDPADLAAQQRILDERARPHYEHRMAA